MIAQKQEGFGNNTVVYLGNIKPDNSGTIKTGDGSEANLVFIWDFPEVFKNFKYLFFVMKDFNPLHTFSVSGYFTDTPNGNNQRAVNSKYFYQGMNYRFNINSSVLNSGNILSLNPTITKDYDLSINHPYSGVAVIDMRYQAPDLYFLLIISAIESGNFNFEVYGSNDDNYDFFKQDNLSIAPIVNIPNVATEATLQNLIAIQEEARVKLYETVFNTYNSDLKLAQIRDNQINSNQKIKITDADGGNLQINPDGSLNVNTDSPNSDALLQTIISNQSSTANSDFLLQTIIDNQTNGNQYTQIPNPLEVFGNINVNQPIEVFGNINVNQPINVNVINDRLPDARLRDDNGDRLDINPDGSINVKDSNSFNTLMNIMYRLNEFTFNVADGSLNVNANNANSDSLLQTIINNQSSTANSDSLLQTIISNQTNGSQFTQIPNPIEVFGNINVNQPIDVNVINDRLPDVRLRDDNGDRLDINPDGSINVNATITGAPQFRNNLTDNELTRYQNIRRDTATSTQYQGFEDKNGNWYIRRDINTPTSSQSSMFIKGTGGLIASATWAARAGLLYNEFNVVF